MRDGALVKLESRVFLQGQQELAVPDIRQKAGLASSEDIASTGHPSVGRRAAIKVRTIMATTSHMTRRTHF